VHKRICEIARKTTEEASSSTGGRKKDVLQTHVQVYGFFASVKGFVCEMGLLAWKYRRDSPLIYASAPEGNADGSKIQIRVVPRTAWDGDPNFSKNNFWFTENHRAVLRHNFDENPLFRAGEHYMHHLALIGEDGIHRSSIGSDTFTVSSIRGTEIVDALTVATEPKDLADAFAWFESAFLKSGAQAQANAQVQMECIRGRSNQLYGGRYTPEGSIPIPTRALNNDVTYMMVDSLCLKFHVQLVGLRSAAHLNGREGVIREPDPVNPERYEVRLDGGEIVSVKSINFVHIHRGEYTRQGGVLVAGI
jgi:hypothetical protein